MRSHLSPNSARSTGSAPASLLHAASASYGSGSSRPSAHSQPHSTSSASGASLAHSGSITSDGRRRGRGAVSPAISAFGRPATGGLLSLAPSPPRSPLGIHAHGRTDTIASVTSGTTTIDTTTGTLQTTGTEPSSPVLHFPSVPWVSGLERSWPPA